MSIDNLQPSDEVQAISRDALAWCDAALTRVDELLAPAADAAGRLLAGGGIYVMGSHGFVCELMGRAGGLAGLKPWTTERLTEKDVVIAGQLLPDEMGGCIHDLSAFARGDTRLRPALALYVAGGDWLLTQRLRPSFQKGWLHHAMLDTHAPAGRDTAAMSLAQMATVATAWALIGEIHSAVARGGRTLATYGSIAEPGGGDWYKRWLGQMFNDELKITPAAPGDNARAYLTACRRQIAAFAASDSPRQVMLAAHRVADALTAGGMAMAIVAGHLLAEDYLIPAELENVILFGRDFEWKRPCILREGDYLVYMAYLDYPSEVVERALALGANVVTFTAEPNGPTNDRQAHIDGHWQRWDSVVDVPGSPYRILPTSGVVQTPQWFAFWSEVVTARGTASP